MPTNPRQQTAQRIARTEAYAAKVQRMFSATVNEILALPLTTKGVGQGTMYSFDAETAKVQRKVEQLLRRLQAATTMAIEKGVELEWGEANAAADAIIRGQFTKKALESPMMQGWNARNLDAMRTFIERSDRGMNLSDRVWQPCRQLRDEMEVALSISIGEGEDAGTISRRVRQYLNDPDLMFRRFRYKDEQGRWQKKWKKRIKDPDNPGKYKFIDYDKDTYRDQWTGRGYYKSSAQNAMRVARTETNIAYRRADHERWQKLDFVLGQRVQMSKNHPMVDICDTLAGDYPKDFVFDGWHPQCFCFVTPILVEPEEIAKMNDAFVRGEEYAPQGEAVTEYPQGFKDWVRDNADSIKAAQSRGTEPYFVRNNADVVEGIINPKKQKQKSLTIAEKAKLRHDARTEEEIERIQLAWDNHRREEYELRMQNQLSIAEMDRIKYDLYDVDCGEFGDHENNRRILDEMRRKLDIHKINLGIWNDLLLTTPSKRKDVIPPISSLDLFNEKTSTILRAAKRHASRTDKEIASIKKEWNTRRMARAKEMLADATTQEQRRSANLMLSDATIRTFEKPGEIINYLSNRYKNIEFAFSGMERDLESIREFAFAIDYHFIQFPKLTKKFKMMGSIQGQYENLKHRMVYDRIKTSGISTKAGIDAATKIVDDWIIKSGRHPDYIGINVEAQSDPFDRYKTNGIFFNQKRSYKEALKGVRDSVKKKWHPQGCDRVKATFDHEFGHKVDELLDVRHNPEFLKFWDACRNKKGTKFITDHLSEYSWNNGNSDEKAEFIAEAWSEYLNNPNPRPIAKFVGKLIEKLISNI